MTENGKKTKDKMAHLHMNILSLRVRRIPRKLALITVPEIFIFALAAHLFGVAVFTWLVRPQIMIWLSFIAISALTSPACRRYMESNRSQYQKSKSDGYHSGRANTGSAHSEYRSNSQQGSGQYKSSQHQSNSQKQSNNQQYSNSQQKSSQQSSSNQKSSQQQNGSQQQRGSQQQSHSQQQSNGRQQNSRQYSSMSVAEAMKLFGLNGSFTAKDLKQAYYREAKKYHPDQNVNKANAEKYKDMMLKINQARDLLSRMCTK